jgi:hypothetical protein
VTQSLGSERVALLTMAALASLFSDTAHAYIDPGTGSLLLQVFGAAVAGAIFYFRELRIRLLSLFSRRGPCATEDTAEPPSGDAPR